MARQLLILLAGFLAGVALATVFGAKNLGTAIGVGQLTFVATLAWVLLKD